MTSRERVIATLKFQNPDQIPIDLWAPRATWLRHGKSLSMLLEEYPLDIIRIFGPGDKFFYPEMSRVGEYVDLWGNTWQMLKEGFLGEVRKHVLADTAKIKGFHPPIEELSKEWEKYDDAVNRAIEQARKKGLFVLGGSVEIFQTMEFIRGVEELFCDIAMESDEFFMLRDIVVTYLKEYIGYWLKKDIDGFFWPDDFGSQRAMLIAPKSFKKLYKEVYKEIVDFIHQNNKYVFYHSCGYIMEIYEDLIDIGFDAINSQLSCMGYDNIASRFSGKTTFWGEIDRQTTLPFGTPDDVRNAVEMMKRDFYVNGGGLIGHSSAGPDVSIENIRVLLQTWNV